MEKEITGGGKDPERHIVSDKYLSLSGNAGRVLQALSYWPTYGLLRFFVRLKVEGQENIKELAHTEVIFASNHTSFIDGPIAAAVMPRFYNKWWPQGFMPIRFTALEQFFYWFNPIPFPIGLFAAAYVRLNGSIPVQRARGDLERALHNVVRVLKDPSNKDKVWFFPEGGLSRDGHVHQGKRGIAHLYKKTGVPIVPVAITGTYNIGVSGFFLRRRSCLVKIGKPMHFEERLFLEEIVDRVMREVARLAGKQYLDNVYESHEKK